MNLEFEIIEIPILNYSKVKFYTIKKEGFEKSEFKDFVDRMTLLGKTDKRVLEDLKVIRSQIKAIGRKFGAEARRFKPEASVFALATHYPQREVNGIFGLRVFCLIISPQIVVLLNGGDKKALKAQNCSNISMKFHEAVYAQKVLNDLFSVNGSLDISGKEIENPNNDTLYWN